MDVRQQPHQGHLARLCQCVPGGHIDAGHRHGAKSLRSQEPERLLQLSLDLHWGEEVALDQGARLERSLASGFSTKGVGQKR